MTSRFTDNDKALRAIPSYFNTTLRDIDLCPPKTAYTVDFVSYFVHNLFSTNYTLKGLLPPNVLRLAFINANLGWRRDITYFLPSSEGWCSSYTKSAQLPKNHYNQSNDGLSCSRIRNQSWWIKQNYGEILVSWEKWKFKLLQPSGAASDISVIHSNPPNPTSKDTHAKVRQPPRGTYFTLVHTMHAIKNSLIPFQTTSV